MNNQPIGIMDSGVGGLTVWREIVRELPHESTVYIADSKNTPYGAKRPEEIYALSHRLMEFLIEKQAKLIVIACNTITVSCLDQLRQDYPHIPLIGTVPVVKAAAAQTKNQQIGILSTTRTAESEYQQQLIGKFAQGCEVTNIGTDDLVPLIEKGITNGTEIEQVLQPILQPFIKGQCDAIALGCTHYPFLRAEMRKILGDQVKLLDSGGAIGRQVRRVMANNHIEHNDEPPKHQFYSTGKKEILEKLLHLLDTRELTVEVTDTTL